MMPKVFPVPTTAHLARAYDELGRLGADVVGAHRPWPYRPALREECVAICGELSRYDPRLFEILVNYFRQAWASIDWLTLRRAMLAIPTPQAFGVIGDLLQSAYPDAERANCFRFLLHRVRPVPTQYFYHLLYTPGSALAARAVERRVAEFERWGFLASHRPVVSQVRKEGIGRLSCHARRSLLQSLVATHGATHGAIHLRDYLGALPHAISRQQALADLKAIPGLRRRGHGRGAVWVQK